MERISTLFLVLLFATAGFAQTTREAELRRRQEEIRERVQKTDKEFQELGQKVREVLKDGQKEEQSEAEEESAKPNPYFERLVPPDRTIQRRYDQALRLSNAGRFPETAQLLGSILEGSVDFFLPPSAEKDDPEKFSRTAHQSFADLVLQHLRELPSKGRESYALQYETQAKRLLEDAVALGAFEGLQRVAKHYFPTTSGAMATFLIGMDQFEQGDWEAALLTFLRLERGHFSVKPVGDRQLPSFEPTFSLSKAACQLRLGREEEASDTIDRFLKNFPEPKLLLGGDESWAPQTAEEILARLRKSFPAETVSTADWVERIGWLLAAGTAAQNPETRADLPLLDLLWAVPTLSQPQFMSRANSLQGHVDRAPEVYIPAPQPLLIGDRLLMRGIGEVTAVDVHTGKRVWSASEPEYRVHRAVQTSSFRPSFRRLSGIPQYLQFTLRIFFWHDRISHQMSSDGNRVFTVEGLDLLPLTSYGHWGGGGRRNIQIGNKSVEDPRTQAGNTVVARDAVTGRTLWQVGKFPYTQKVFDRLAEEYEQSKQEKARESAAKKADPDKATQDGEKKEDEKKPDDDVPAFSEEEIFLGETWFLGAPLPIRGRLYLIGEHAGTLRLFILESETGKLIAQQPLAQAETAFESDWLRRYYGLIPSASGGIVLCPTGLGMVVALDTATASPLWCFSYATPPEETPNNRNQFQQTRYFQYGTSGSNDEFRNMFSKTGWQVPCMMIDGGRVLVAPPDVPSLYCLDLQTGELLWQRDEIGRANSLYVACIRNGTAYVVTPVSMIAFSMETGQPVWNTALSEASVSNPPDSSGPLPVPFRRDVPVPGTAQQSGTGVPATEAASTEKAAPTLPELVFPGSLRPTGVGVHHAERYFLPLSGGCLGLVDLDRGVMELTASPFVALPEMKTIGPKTDVATLVSDEMNEGHGNDMVDVLPEESSDSESAAWRPEEMPDSPTSHNVALGNLIGIRGRFFSQAPLRVACFDQWEALRRRTDEMLKANPDAPEGLLQLGRLRCAEGKISESVDLFRRSLRSKRTEAAVDALRKTLLAAVRSDYPAWAASADELERLAEFPEELGEILFVLARGALRTECADALVDAIQKAIRLETDHSVSVAIDSRWTSQLHRALGILLEQRLREKPDSELAVRLRQLSETMFDRFSTGDTGPSQPVVTPALSAETRSSLFLTRPWWEQDSLASSGEIHRWRVFETLFRSLPAADRARDVLEKQYEKNRLFVSLEMSMNPPNRRPLPESVSKIVVSDSSNVSSDARIPPPYLPDPLPEIDVPRRLAEILRSLGARADAYHYYRMLKDSYGEAGEKIYLEALERPEMMDYYNEEIAPNAWPGGVVRLLDGETSPLAPQLERQNPHGWAVLQILRGTRSQAQIATNRSTIPFLGTDEPFLSPYRYSMETTHQDVHLVCLDEDGKERWRCNLSTVLPGMSEYGYFSEHNHYRQGFSDPIVYLKGCNHLLLFVRGSVMVALDTFECGDTGEPKVLWTKTATGSLSGRQLLTALNLNHIVHSTGPQGTRMFPRETVFVAPQVVCYRDVDRIYGLDPVTGRTLWSRETPAGACSIFGDRKNVFLVHPESRRAVALDPSSGKELTSGTIPPGGIFASGTSLVFVEQVGSNHNTKKPTSRLKVGNLCDLLDLPRSRPSPDKAGEKEPASIPTYVIREGLSNESLVRTVCDDRFLASVSWETRTLQVYDLQTRRDLLGPEGDWGRRVGVKLPDSETKNPRWFDGDFDVEWFEDKFLVLFVEKRNVDSSQKNEVEDGVSFKRIRTVVNNVACRGVGLGTLMLYEPDGTPAWKEPARIEDWFRLLNVSPRSPVVLLTFAANDQERGGVNHFSTALCGIDKRTGQMRFRSLIPPLTGQAQTVLQGFRVVVDRQRKVVSFVAPNRTIDAEFTDQKPEPPEIFPDAPAAAPKNKRPWNFHFDFNFNFGN